MRVGRRPCFLWAALVVCLCCPVILQGGDARGGGQSAAQPESWLVLYNLDVPESVEWANWYQAQRNIPADNMIGLHASPNEHLPSLQDVQNQIVNPVRQRLDQSKPLREQIMGILLGYRLPGHYAAPPLGGPGGFSVADALQDMYDDHLPPAEQKENNLNCPFYFDSVLPPGGRLTRATMVPNTYIVARIDGPTLDDAKALTIRAKEIESGDRYINMDLAWYDYRDPLFSSGIWPWLRAAVEDPAFSEIPWQEFDSDEQGTFMDAFRIDAHDVDGWNDGRLFSWLPGSRIFAYNLNSWGATTLRSADAEGGRFVPNALVNGYAAAIGATGEPQFASPFPRILVGCLREGWTIGESFFLSNPLNDWMWTLVGDPLMRVPNWFDDHPPIPVGTGDINQDQVVDGVDIVLMSQILLGQITDPTQLAAADMSGDGLINDDDAFLILGPAIWGMPAPEELRGTGDVNADGRVNALDLETFTVMLLDEDLSNWPLRLRWAADMNLDGRLTFEDLGSFASCVTQITPDEIPPQPPPAPDPDPEP